MFLQQDRELPMVLLLVSCEARVEIILEALDVGRVHFQGCLEAKLQGCAALELRRRGTLLHRLPQRKGAHRRELLRKLRLTLSTRAMQGGRRFLAVAGEVHDLRLLPSGAALELRRRNVLLRRLRSSPQTAAQGTARAQHESHAGRPPGAGQ